MVRSIRWNGSFHDFSSEPDTTVLKASDSLEQLCQEEEDSQRRKITFGFIKNITLTSLLDFGVTVGLYGVHLAEPPEQAESYSNSLPFYEQIIDYINNTVSLTTMISGAVILSVAGAISYMIIPILKRQYNAMLSAYQPLDDSAQCHAFDRKYTRRPDVQQLIYGKIVHPIDSIDEIDNLEDGSHVYINGVTLLRTVESNNNTNFHMELNGVKLQGFIPTNELMPYEYVLRHTFSPLYIVGEIESWDNRIKTLNFIKIESFGKAFTRNIVNPI